MSPHFVVCRTDGKIAAWTIFGGSEVGRDPAKGKVRVINSLATPGPNELDIAARMGERQSLRTGETDLGLAASHPERVLLQGNFQASKAFKTTVGG